MEFVISAREPGRPRTPRVKASDEELRALENVFRVFVAHRREDDLYNAWLKNWIEDVPDLNEHWYRTIPWQTLTAVYVDDAYAMRQQAKDWEFPAWPTFKRYVRQRPPDGVPLDRMEDFLFVASALIKQLEWNTSTKDRDVYAKRAMYRLRPDIEALQRKVKSERARLERLENEDLLLAPVGRNSRSKSRRFSHQCGELAYRFPPQERYVPLTLITEERASRGTRGNIKDLYDDLIEATEDANLPLVVLLGDPGSGKTTLIRRLYAEKLREASEREERQIPLLVTLGSTGAGKSVDPEKLIFEAWELTYGRDLASFSEVSKRGHVFLLLDGFNEGANADVAVVWKAFLQEKFLAVHGNRAVVSCRTIDYALPLGGDGIYVPHLRIAPLDPRGIMRYLDQASFQAGNALLNAILGNRALTTLYGSPFFLSVLVDDGDASHGMDASRTHLLTRLVWRRLYEEYSRAPLAFADPLFTESDRYRIANSRSFNPTIKLPDQGTFIPFLSKLAFAMGNHTRMEVDEAERLAASTAAPEKGSHIKVACATGLMTLDFQEWTVSFTHQLIQELFAAHQIVNGGGNDGIWRFLWRKEELLSFEPHSLEEQLPSLPSTGWEEATVMATVLSQNQDDFVTRVFVVNPLLAARCANASNVTLSRQLCKQIQDRLHEIEHAEEADFRARLTAGLLITDVERLGYEQKASPVAYLVPPNVAIQPGEYVIGAPSESSDGLKWHAHKLALDEGVVQLGPFQMCAFHVTNAEFGLFVLARGYENPDWWPDGGARRWLDPDGFFNGLLEQLDVDIETDRQWGADWIKSQINHRWTSEQGQHKIARLSWTKEQKELWLRKEVERIGSPRYPELWFNPDFNTPTQPVVGVSWYEATAYCRWLSAMTGDLYRLPTEQEYEVVARGLAGLAVPYGDEADPTRSNIRTSGIWRPTPIGLYPEGQFRGIHDLIGNVWTWTSSFDPPEDTGERARRVTRGGSYDTSPQLARAYFRDSNHPGNRNRYDGFRMVKQISAS